MNGFSPATHSAADIVRRLDLQPLPHEGGWFRPTTPASPARAAAPGFSAILAMFTPDQFSALHQLAQDELWLFHAGDPLDLLLLFPDGRGDTRILGAAPGSEPALQQIVPGGVWQGARVRRGGRWTLVSCVVVPAFSWDHFALGTRGLLTRAYPAWSEEINALTRT